MCESFCLSHICKPCQALHLTPSLYKRKLPNGTEVLSFYKYKEIKELLHTKHTDLGYYIYNIMAKNSFTLFAKEFDYPTMTYSLGVDDTTKSGYSHTAILNKALNSNNITPLYAKLRAKNAVSYSGKSKSFRKQNPREFYLKETPQDAFILVDDIITTGTTLLEATQSIIKESKEVLFCLTLADASY